MGRIVTLSVSPMYPSNHQSLLIRWTLIAMLFCSSCTPLDQETTRTPNPKLLTRVTTFAKQTSSVLTAVTGEVVPVVKAVNDEVSSELRADLTKIREEVSLQMCRPLPSRANSSTL
jgi:hypothetical protein